MADTYTTRIKLVKPEEGKDPWTEDGHRNLDLTDYALGPLLGGNYLVSGGEPSDGGGLTLSYTAWEAVVGGAHFSGAAGSKTCAASKTNYLYVDSSGAVQISTSTPSGDYVPLAAADASESSLERVVDLRRLSTLRNSSLTASRLLATDANKTPESTDLSSWISGTANRVTVTDDGDGSVTLSTPQDIDTGASPTFSGLTLTGPTASRLAALDASGGLTDTDLSSWISGTANRVTVTDDGDGSVTLSTPQDIDTGASVTFSEMALTETAGDHSASPTLRLGDGDSGIYEASDDVVAISTGGAERVRVDGTKILVNETANALMTAGVTVNQGTSDDNVLECKSSDVSHTGLGWPLEADSFFAVRKENAAGGARIVSGGPGGTYARMTLDSWLDAAPTNGTVKASTATAYIQARAVKNNGYPDANENLFCVSAKGACVAIIDREGELHLDATTTEDAWDGYNDPEVCVTLERMLAKKALPEFLRANAEALHRKGVITRTVHEDGREEIFLAVKGVTMLQLGAIGQLYKLVKKQAERIKELEGKLLALEGAV